MTSNNFRLIGTFCSTMHGRWTYYQPCIRLQYTSPSGKIRVTTLKKFGTEHRSHRKALAQLPQILRKESAAQYDDAVAAAIAELGTCQAYKVVGLRSGETRSLFHSDIVYRIGEICAHPVLPDFEIGLYVYPDLDSARAYMRRMASDYPDEYAIIRVETPPLQQINGNFVAAAIKPAEIVEVLPFYYRKVNRLPYAKSGRLYQWDIARNIWILIGDVSLEEIADKVVFTRDRGSYIVHYLRD